MIKKLLPIIFLIVGLGAGVGAGIALGPSGPAETEVDEKAAHSDDAEKTAETDHQDPGDAAENYEYLKMTKPFVIPLVRHDEVSGLATMTLSLELDAGQSDSFYAKEPKLRDNFLQVLFDHANMGGFDGAFTKSSTLDPLREALLDIARTQLGDIVQSVLITDIARQDSY